MKDLILHCLTGFNREHLTDTSRHKFYPLSVFCSFDFSLERLTDVPEEWLHKVGQKRGLICRCGNQIHASYYGYLSTYVLVTGPDQMEIVCARRCMPPETMDYRNQQYGYREPIQFPPQFEASVLHRMIWYAIRGHLRYRFRAYREVTSEQIREFNLWNEGAGGTFGVLGWRFYDQRGFKFTASNYREGESVSFSEAKALAALNEILAWNYDQQPKQPKVGEQLSLF